MRLIPALLIFVLLGVSVTEAGEAEPPTEFDNYYMVFLMRPDQPQDHGEERNAQLQREHLGHLTWLWEEGYALVAGPFGSADDDPMRGIVLFRGDLGAERVRELAEMDPRVKAGQLRVDIRPWYTAAGALAFPMQPGGAEEGDPAD